MAFQSKTDAKEDFKKLIVKTIGEAKDFYSNLKYFNFINSVTMLDCMLGSYKDDPQFISNAMLVNQANEVQQNEMNILKLEGINTSALDQKRKYFISWFRILIDLSIRSVFAGRMTNVDIDLAEVWDDWKRMLSVTDHKHIERGLVDRSTVDIHDEPEEIIEEDVIEGVLE